MSTSDSSESSDPIDPRVGKAIEQHVTEGCSRLGIDDPRRIQELTRRVVDLVRRRLELAEPERVREVVQTLLRGLQPLTLAAKAESPFAVMVEQVLRAYPREGRWWADYYRNKMEIRQIAATSGVTPGEVCWGIRCINEELLRWGGGKGGTG